MLPPACPVQFAPVERLNHVCATRVLDLIAPPLYGGRRLVRTAQVIINPTKIDTVALGNTVTFGRDNGRVQTYRIVGEDEADPKADSISSHHWSG